MQRLVAPPGFLADLCKKWEEATHPIPHTVCVTHTRFGVILSPRGGMLKKMVSTFKLGLGAYLGSGEQMISWVSLDDVVRALDFLLHHPMPGAVNVCAPHPLSQASFARLLAAHLHRPLVLRLPAPLLRFLAGEMADELLLTSQAAHPTRLMRAGFHFMDEHLQDFLKKISP
jgi:uncharacterized protein